MNDIAATEAPKMADPGAAMASDAMEHGLAVVSIAKSYDKRAVLSDVSLSVGRGEVVGLLGPNGAGKTTCFYSVMGLVKPDAGRIMLDGEDITSLPMYRRAILGIGYLPQETSIFRGMTVEQNIMAVLEMVEPDAHAREESLDRLLDEFGFEVAQFARHGPVRRRTAAMRDCACPSGKPVDRPPGRALCRYRSAVDRRHTRSGLPVAGTRHWRPDHRP